MSAFKHTPGPWEVAGGYVRTRFDGRNGGFSIARVESLNDERDANAAVMAAAPELLAAARTVSMLRQLGGLLPGAREVVMAAVEAADAAIAKATGGAE